MSATEYQDGYNETRQGNSAMNAKLPVMCACGCGRELVKPSVSCSRYAPLYITNDCGVKEAFEGFYWRGRFDRIGKELVERQRGFEPW